MCPNYKDFTGQVQHRIKADTQAEAVRTIRSVLETLGERVEEGGATDIASPLPMEIDRYLLQVAHGQTYNYDEFVDSVVARLNYDDLDLKASYGRPSNVDRAEAVYRTKAVVALLSETVPGGEIAHVEEQLPVEFDNLFEFVDLETPPWEQESN
ncbi:DUF2267 domain-containing protein [halophilic archaeon]|nr:DUF2267 domain-containing protein [halophilic archaeon]